ncbi:fatty acid desaturase [Patescibacteria group bacterium]|nr:fatty acid desaturase [Patescibacteria group bacterium]
MLLLEGIGIRLTSIQFLRKGDNVKYPKIEPILMLAHFVVYAGLVFFFMNVWQGILFITIHQAMFGLYLGSVFAPNHKGMLIPDETVQRDFLLLQVLTARNLRGNPIIDFVYGGLGYQIEHHLFTSMPRNNLRKAQKIVRAFCWERSIPYQESTFIQSWREILSSLHNAGTQLPQGISQEA